MAVDRPSETAFSALSKFGLYLILVAIVSFVSYDSKIILHPVYGSVGTALYHDTIVFIVSTATCLAVFLGFGLDNLPCRTWRSIAIVLLFAPLALPTLFSFSGELGPIWGPILTQAQMTWPCIFLVSYDISRYITDAFGKEEIRSSLVSASFFALFLSFVVTVVVRFSERIILLPYFQPYIGILWSRYSILVYLGVFASAMDVLLVARREATYFLILLLGAAAIILGSPHVTTGVTPGLLARLPSGYIYLARQESITGMIAVVENPRLGFRVLKCDHSLLGGLWTGLKHQELSAQGIREEELERRSMDEAESVYGAFLIQEAVLLVKRPAKRDKALIM